ncbi:hypothetical protein HYH03_008310 [Edaphochlamys debaryana]|uniref:Glycosyltransferase n=1 Tax=Edaphochlamys debaryana TaxID=47281 RepID=A0A836BZK9_9CHLO|nr:hypothetical protein HYH03_008310 [Edaphochlamys debaryana]|eukprot:KAG2493494.1 hypothetical protein HYH03_008310 [Edaphochlamys debaryana]
MENNACLTLKRVCVDEGMLVLFNNDSQLTPQNPYGSSRMDVQAGQWNFPSRGGANSDALVGHMRKHFIPTRRASRLESNPALVNPVFSNCTLPVFILQDWPYNMGEVLARLAAMVDVLFEQQGLADHRATLVLATPMGLGLTPYHLAFLEPHSLHAVVSLDAMSSRPHAAALHPALVAWSDEGHVSCFETAVYCMLEGRVQDVVHTARTLLKHMLPLLPPDPLGFGSAGEGRPLPPLAEDTTLRVVLEARSGPARSFKNLDEIVRACSEANQRGFVAGRFRGIACRVLHTADTPELHGLRRFHASVAAVRSAHLLVAIHGAGAANCAFMEEGGIAGLLEIRPCRLGTFICFWPDGHMAGQLAKANHTVRMFAYNVEDPAQCLPSDYEAEELAHPRDFRKRKDLNVRMRDQHVVLNPRQFMAYLTHVAALLSDKSAYHEALRADRVHGYPLAEGLALGALCVKNKTRLEAAADRSIK